MTINEFKITEGGIADLTVAADGTDFLPSLPLDLTTNAEYLVSLRSERDARRALDAAAELLIAARYALHGTAPGAADEKQRQTAADKAHMKVAELRGALDTACRRTDGIARRIKAA